ncbi:pentatricopeptide repeat-containing protein At2g15630, mitochondrial [Rosa chinensis]|uniref:pentatricopeptide repeat-containing protein At2g15630, mitochondrial n=1 Tax=Rosa chinensis TaxID=74649 RepID=UPI001AD93F6B|nr:pentatricopeptide repeat-containing protein At2g15630, mitochondrial [Rosa chinensis]
MTSGNIMPKTEPCNELLSLFSKLNRTERAWVLYADMFGLKIKSSVCTFNIMINVLCKEGKLNKAKEFLGFMRFWGLSQPTVVTYNTIIHGFCLRGRVGGAQMIFGAMKGRGVQRDSYTYGLLISGMCKERRLDEASGLFDKMLEIGLLPSAVTYNTLIDGYCNKGDLDKAFGYRDEMVNKGAAASSVARQAGYGCWATGLQVCEADGLRGKRCGSSKVRQQGLVG